MSKIVMVDTAEVADWHIKYVPEEYWDYEDDAAMFDAAIERYEIELAHGQGYESGDALRAAIRAHVVRLWEEYGYEVWDSPEHEHASDIAARLVDPALVVNPSPEEFESVAVAAWETLPPGPLLKEES